MSKVLDNIGGLPLFDTPPPSGPEAEEYTKDEKTQKAFYRLLAEETGQAFWEYLQKAALAALHEGEKRFSVRGALYEFRTLKKGRIANDFTPWFADKLVAHHPELDDIVQRKKRTKDGPYYPKS